MSIIQYTDLDCILFFVCFLSDYGHLLYQKAIRIQLMSLKSLIDDIEIQSPKCTAINDVQNQNSTQKPKLKQIKYDQIDTLGLTPKMVHRFMKQLRNETYGDVTVVFE